MDSRQYSNERAAETRLLPGMAFIAENPEAYGLVPDTCPVVTSDLLLAANGHGATGGSLSPTYPVEKGGVDGLLDSLYGTLITRTDENARVLRGTFGESEGMQEHPVARYCAALAEVTALQILDGTAKEVTLEQMRHALGEEIPRKLSRLRETVCDDEATPRDDALFAVSMGACRITPEGEGRYLADIFVAGDFKIYLLDEAGLRPLWLDVTPYLSPDSREGIGHRRIVLDHPQPFALLLLSDSLCALSAAEIRAQRENPGMIWRYRMRLEEQLLRLITACVREQEFGERAARFFTGRSHGRDSASGAMRIMREGVSYEVYRSMCQTRLSCLEDMISLLPDGYDPTRIPARMSREETEEKHLRRILEREKGVSSCVAEAVRLCVLEKLNRGDVGEAIPPPEDVPAYRRLSREEISCAFRRHDAENDADRARIAENRRILRDNLTDHWIALRPYLLQVSHRDPTPAAQRSYAACADMSRRLGRMLAGRKHRLSILETLLADSLAILRAEERDWMEGRAGDGSVEAWVAGLTERLPGALTALSESWQTETEAYRSLMTAYTHEREMLFRMDTNPADGFFAVDWQAMQSGELLESRRNTLGEALSSAPAYRELWESLCHVSKGTGALFARVKGRGAERRTARDLADRPDIRLAALRASAYEDEDWGDSVVAIMDPAMRREHMNVVRRWLETRELAAKRAEAYAVYSTSWRAFLPDGGKGKYE
ncbi:MAG: hypothetical protein IKM33_07510 [Clostridia bacterium]|nr:hypothetical protein [Clostridia bacterium]